MIQSRHNCDKTGRWKKRLATGLAVLAGLWGAAAQTAEPQPVQLRGYGKVTYIAATPGASGTASFLCDSSEKADLLFSKLLADLQWDTLLGPKTIELAPGQPAYQRNADLTTIVQRGTEVRVLYAPSADALRAELVRQGLSGTDVTWLPQKRHPAYLDYYDLAAIEMCNGELNVLGLGKAMGKTEWFQRFDRDVLHERYAFWNRMGFRFGANVRPLFGFYNKLDGPAHFFPTEHEIKLTRENNTPLAVWFGPHMAPWWFRNQFPDQVVQFDPLGIWEWGGALEMGNSFPAKCASPEAMSYIHRYNLSFLDCVKTAGDNLSNIRVASGIPGDEDTLHGLSTEFMGHGPAELAGLRAWLRDERGLNLQTLGERWHGDANHYKSWDEVMLPSRMSFFGDFSARSLDLHANWLFRPDPATGQQAVTEGWGREHYRPGPEWLPIDLAPSVQQKLFTEGQPTWFRKEFDAAAWLEKNKGQQVYVVINSYTPSRHPIDVYLNDAYLGQLRSKDEYLGPIAFRATALLRPGNNLLALRVPEGVIRGPVFLTTQEPKRYPYLGKTANARWVDWRDWLTELVIRSYRDAARPVRERAPDLPMQFVPGGNLQPADHFAALQKTVGITSIHFTGGGSSYVPWWRGLGYVLKTYGSSEEGGGPDGWKPAGYTRELAWMLLDGIGHHTFYYLSPAYIAWEKETHWFEQNKRLLTLLGKANWRKPQIAVLRSARNERYFPDAQLGVSWDIGRGALQAIHYNNVFVTETEVRSGLAGAYPVLFDSNSAALDEETLNAIEAYVQAGGTFVALNLTGRHTPLEADVWPVSRLTGFKVIGERQGRLVTVLKENPLLKRLAGTTVSGDGMAIDWQGVNHADTGIALEAQMPEAQPLATWEDGSIAAGVRTLGKGRIITLGSTFWRSGSDLKGTGVPLNGSIQSNFLEDLFAGLGIEKDVDCDSSEVWARRLLTKNGLQEWIVLYNNSGVAASPLTVTLPLAMRPEAVYDLNSAERLPFTYDAGRLTVRLELAAGGLRALGWDQGAGGEFLNTWFAEKRDYWKALDLPAVPAAIKLPEPTMAVMENFRFRMAGAEDKHDGWTTATTTSEPWREMGFGFWDDAGLPAQGTGLYRAQLTVPSAWQGRKVMLGFISFDFPVFTEKAAVYLNGKKAAEYQGHNWANFDTFEVTSRLQPGINEVAVRVESPHARGGYLGQMAFYALEKLDSIVELKDNWQLYQNTRDHVPVALPTNGAKGRFLEIEMDVPADWNGQNIFLEMEGKGLVMLMVNQRPLALNNWHPVNGVFQANLFPLIKPGEKNRIALFTWGTITNGNGDARTTTAPYHVNRVVLGIKKP